MMNRERMVDNLNESIEHCPRYHQLLRETIRGPALARTRPEAASHAIWAGTMEGTVR